MYKEVVVYTHTHTHTHTHTQGPTAHAFKKNEILPFAATWMGLEGVTLSEINQTEKDKYCICMWNLKNTANH